MLHDIALWKFNVDIDSDIDTLAAGSLR